jgi:hypothetical protein
MELAIGFIAAPAGVNSENSANTRSHDVRRIAEIISPWSSRRTAAAKPRSSIAKPAWGKVRHPFARAESPTEHDAASKRSLVLEGPSMHFAASFLRIGLE